MDDAVGFGALGEALAALARENFRKVLVIASESGWKRFTDSGDRPFFAERETQLFSGFSPNPDVSDILAGVDAARAFAPDCLLALGGGSAIDTAKGIKAMLYAEGGYDAMRPETVKISGGGPPLVAIATTAGSGAEATPSNVFFVGKKKYSFSHPSLRPQMAVADPELTYSLSPRETAVGGFDALSQGVESFWSASATEASRMYAAAAVKAALPNLYNAVHAPGPGNRYAMTMAAHNSGKAIAVTRTTLPHGLAYHLTHEYGLPHGHAVALSLPYFFRLNMTAPASSRYPGGGEAQRRNMGELLGLMGFTNGDDCFAFWRNLLNACGLVSRPVDAGVDTREKVEAWIGSFDVANAATHPVSLTGGQLVECILAHP